MAKVIRESAQVLDLMTSDLAMLVAEADWDVNSSIYYEEQREAEDEYNNSVDDEDADEDEEGVFFSDDPRDYQPDFYDEEEYPRTTLLESLGIKEDDLCHDVLTPEQIKLIEESL